ncbi:type IV pilin protein [Acinetobacter terrae]|uniref:type IV pilin protein n=1 Tax=Acinetobacter terrae TaxID=2731247 RepID=UPI0007D7CE37|nr:type IV pilin protein [Acinetobacter terrae]OAL75941.1 competence protein ComE [Acinetobacter terrae]
MSKIGSHQGYTLIELMVVVVIIAIFAIIAIPGYQYYVARSFQAEAQAEIQKLSERLENYRGKQLTYAEFIPEHQEGTDKGVIHLPYSSGGNYNYQIKIVDINDPTKSLEDSVLGQGWKIIAVPNQLKTNALRQAKSFLLTSRGLSCESSAVLTVNNTSC